MEVDVLQATLKAFNDNSDQAAEYLVSKGHSMKIPKTIKDTSIPEKVTQEAINEDGDDPERLC